MVDTNLIIIIITSVFMGLLVVDWVVVGTMWLIRKTRETKEAKKEIDKSTRFYAFKRIKEIETRMNSLRKVIDTNKEIINNLIETNNKASEREIKIECFKRIHDLISENKNYTLELESLKTNHEHQSKILCEVI